MDIETEIDPRLKPFSGKLLSDPVQSLFKATDFYTTAAVIGGYEVRISQCRDCKSLVIDAKDGIRIAFIRIPPEDVRYLMTHYGIQRWAIVDYAGEIVASTAPVTA